MKRFIALITFTEQGMRTVHDSPERADAFIAMATAAGAKINALYWTVGRYDGLVSFDAEDEETATALMVKLSSTGNVKTETLRAFPREGIERILGKAAEL